MCTLVYGLDACWYELVNGVVNFEKKNRGGEKKKNMHPDFSLYIQIIVRNYEHRALKLERKEVNRGVEGVWERV